jgi:hypothetical protein
MVIGVILLIYFSQSKPERIAQTGEVFLDEPEMKDPHGGWGVP